MPNIIILILSLIGRILLGLLAFVLLLLLLILFFPITYRLKGERREDRLTFSARADWLFGVLRARYSYPEPGKVTVMLLWKKLTWKKQIDDTPAPLRRGADKQKTDNGGAVTDSDTGEETAGTETGDSADGKPDAADPCIDRAADSEERQEGQQQPEDEGTEQSSEKASGGLLGKISKIKYTILKIYGKIKDIWEHLSYYNGVLREDNTVALWKHVRQRLGKMLRAIRPRRINGSIVFGTGAPDTTGYLFGGYGMLSPLLHYGFCVTPDFTQQILEGNVDISGHITLWVLTWNVLKLLLDKKLRLFIKKMKAGRREAESKA